MHIEEIRQRIHKVTVNICRVTYWIHNFETNLFVL